MHPYIINIPYRHNFILDLFASIAHKPWSMLLHSGHSDHPDSRFDILVTSPHVTITSKNGITRIKHKNKYQINSNHDPFKILQQQINYANIKTKENDNLPFQGGLIGVFGYDLIRYLKKLPTIAKRDLNLPDMAIGLYRWTIITDHHLYVTTLISHDNPKKILSWINQNKIFTKNQKFCLKSPWLTNMNPIKYKKKFKTIQKYLQNGDCYQICLAQRFCASYTGNEWIAFRHLLNQNRSPFSAFIRLTHHTISCLSPERFIRLKGTKIDTKPIKGTISRNKNINIDQKQLIRLITSQKDKSENLMIVDLLRNDIGQIAIPGSVRVPKLFTIESFPAVHHMVSTITGILPNNLFASDILRACFPGGSITGAPKISAMRIIDMLEPHRRNVWCGSIAYLSCCGNMDSNILIRSLITEKQKIFCSVGSAIVIDSDEHLEYQEMLDKVSTIIFPLKYPIY
ncbi:aminodeoxychorismate synthase component I [Blochmannia endosymbiont of Camponotus (Colobopsis) obliquus]|uniref:aminodeoxychorismate synthase component I n=1 Tax=Blochmannia endosymbiont of Camponotus (Colobopsis) obliquus TaxID=1505597 RepID=UPI00061A67CB|nr:aminodeoxychorismate synthase component I [Blochmannia endosymbiont of Camponotus (Colobopsis) obliquus]AKC60598.1 para-aminobenzoate synthase component 1 [Blochmannia endosymbiont of Camponotus (Colobopsis) obliquus]